MSVSGLILSLNGFMTTSFAHNRLCLKSLKCVMVRALYTPKQRSSVSSVNYVTALGVSVSNTAHFLFSFLGKILSPLILVAKLIVPALALS